MRAHYYISKFLGSILRESALYASEAVGFDSANVFINQSLIIESPKGADEILSEIVSIDTIFSRKRSAEGYSDRTIDIDIILSSDEKQAKTAEIPHPRWKDRNFVIVPSLEIMEGYFDSEMSQVSVIQEQALTKFL